MQCQLTRRPCGTLNCKFHMLQSEYPIALRCAYFLHLHGMQKIFACPAMDKFTMHFRNYQTKKAKSSSQGRDEAMNDASKTVQCQKFIDACNQSCLVFVPHCKTCYAHTFTHFIKRRRFGSKQYTYLSNDKRYLTAAMR